MHIYCNQVELILLSVLGGGDREVLGGDLDLCHRDLMVTVCRWASIYTGEMLRNRVELNLRYFENPKGQSNQNKGIKY